jgi:hypothetical protein
MVNIGDTVLVTVRTWVPSIGLFYDEAGALQQRLQAAGFRVLNIDDSGLSSIDNFSYSELLVTVQPLTSAYARAEDIGSIVAGATEPAGYGGVDGYSAVVIASDTGYEDNLEKRRPKDPNEKSLWDQLADLFGISTTTLEIAGVVVAGIVVLSLTRK